VHTLEREKIARRLSEQRPEALPPLEVLVQVKVSGEDSKSGVAPREAAALAIAVAAMPRLRLRGLMAVPEPTDDERLQRARFRELRELYEALKRAGLSLDTLSMGMTADMEAAIAEGSTMVRIGTAIFGQRQKVKDAA
jgi:pyridoxal phosphate enzyme (YggS family)